jgi:hypothetical protein
MLNTERIIALSRTRSSGGTSVPISALMVGLVPYSTNPTHMTSAKNAPDVSTRE